MVAAAGVMAIATGVLVSAGATRPATALATTTRETSPVPVIACVLSYTNDYQWQAQIVEGLVDAIGNRAEIEFYSLDTIGVTDEPELVSRGRAAMQWIDALEPDLVVLADDNAMRFVADVVLETTELPVVFCGVNWPATRYDLAHDRLGGMVEVSPVERGFDLLNGSLGYGGNVAILGADRPTDRAQSVGFERVAEERGFQPQTVLVSTFDEWADAFVDLQADNELVYLLNNAGIEGWSDERAAMIVASETRAITATEYVWMKPFVVLSLIKQGQEQGRWAGLQALHILERPDFPAGPIVVNRDSTVSVNRELLSTAGRELPRVFDAIEESHR